MNEFVFEAGVHREASKAPDLLCVAMRLAETPCSAIGYNSPERLLQEMVARTMH